MQGKQRGKTTQQGTTFDDAPRQPSLLLLWGNMAMQGKQRGNKGGKTTQQGTTFYDAPRQPSLLLLWGAMAMQGKQRGKTTQQGTTFYDAPRQPSLILLWATWQCKGRGERVVQQQPIGAFVPGVTQEPPCCPAEWKSLSQASPLPVNPAPNDHWPVCWGVQSFQLEAGVLTACSVPCMRNTAASTGRLFSKRQQHHVHAASTACWHTRNMQLGLSKGQN